jgi:branched-chain amino acid transport system substrate-binding protein
VLGTDALIPPSSVGTRPIVDYATSAALDPSQLPASGQKFVGDFRSAYGRAPGRYAAYGYEAMAVVLDSIDRSAGDTISRQDVIDAFFDTLDRDSIVGTYSIDAVGNTTLDRMTGYRVKPGRIAAVKELRSR